MNQGETSPEMEAYLRQVDSELDEAERIVSIAFVARKLAVTTTTVRNWILAGRIRAGKTITGRYRIPVSELARLIKLQHSKEPKLR